MQITHKANMVSHNQKNHRLKELWSSAVVETYAIMLQEDGIQQWLLNLRGESGGIIP